MLAKKRRKQTLRLLGLSSTQFDKLPSTTQMKLMKHPFELKVEDKAHAQVAWERVSGLEKEARGKEKAKVKRTFYNTGEHRRSLDNLNTNNMVFKKLKKARKTAKKVLKKATAGKQPAKKKSALGKAASAVWNPGGHDTMYGYKMKNAAGAAVPSAAKALVKEPMGSRVLKRIESMPAYKKVKRKK